MRDQLILRLEQGSELIDIAASTSSRSRSVHSAGRGFVRELGDGGSDPTPDVRPVVVVRHELVSARGAFLDRLVAIALEHQLRRVPNVDLRDHALKLHIYSQ